MIKHAKVYIMIKILQIQLCVINSEPYCAMLAMLVSDNSSPAV
jgi:hypothetical protein